MKLKVKEDYIQHSVFYNNKRIYFTDMSDKQKKFWFDNGFEYIFESKKTKKDDDIKIEQENDTDK